MKTGVLTFHRCINYGSYWQARCLLDLLRAHGHDPVLLDHDSPNVNLAEWRCALRPVLPAPAPASDRRLYAQKTRMFFDAFETLPRTRRFALEGPEETEAFDLVVVGSDEVWNLEHPWYARRSLFFGERVRAKRLVAHAASFGSYPAAAGLPPHWADRLRAFERISVRDENSRSLVRAVLGVAPELALDPCLQAAPQPGDASAEPPGNATPYAAVYGHGFSDWFGSQMRRWARYRKLRLVSIGYRNDWADEQWIAAHPEDFPRFIAGAEAVATNFFHGCVFALRHERPFLCENSRYRALKLRDLMAAVGGEQHLVAPETAAGDYERVLSEPPSAAIRQRIEQQRRSSAASLARALAPTSAPVDADAQRYADAPA